MKSKQLDIKFDIFTKIILSKLLLFFYIISFSQEHAQKSEDFKSSGKIWGYMYGDMLYKAGGDTLYFGKGEYATMEKNTIGGRLRRIYFGYDYHINPKWSTRLLLEGTASSTTAGGNFGMYVKLGYLQYDHVFKNIPNSTLRVGLIPTPVFTLPEKSWGYRSVEKEALELRGLGNAADQGVSFEGSFDKKNSGGFAIVVGNGSGSKPTIGKYLEYYISVNQKFFKKRLNIEVMLDYKKIDKELSRTLTRGFLSYEIPNFRLGVEVSPDYVKEKVTFNGQKIVVTTQPLLTSLFMATKVVDKIWLFARYDYFNPDLNYDKAFKYGNTSQNYDENLLIGGLHIIANENVNIFPNLYISTYHLKNEAFVHRKPDVVLRTTAYFIF